MDLGTSAAYIERVLSRKMSSRMSRGHSVDESDIYAIYRPKGVQWEYLYFSLFCWGF